MYICVCVFVCKLLKESMEYYFCLDILHIFLHHIHMGVTCFKTLFIFYILQKKRMQIDQVRAE